MKKLLFITVGLLCAGAVGVTWNATRTTQEAEIALARVVQQQTAASAEVGRTEERATAAEQEEARLRTALAGLQQNQIGDLQTPLSESAEAARSAEAQALMKQLKEQREQASRPTAQLKEFVVHRCDFLLANRPLFDRLGLSPAQIERFVEIELKRFETSLDMKPLFNQGLLAGRDDPIADKLAGDARAKADAAYRQLLGEAGFQQFQEFRRTDVARTIVGGVVGVALLSDAPYTPAQTEQMVQALAASDSRYLGGQDVQWHTIDWNIADAKLRRIMSDAQWTLFKTTDGGWDQHYSRSFGAQESATRAEANRTGQATKPPPH